GLHSHLKEMPCMLLAGDIGGTKTNLALYASETELRTPVALATVPSARYPSLEALVSEFLLQALDGRQDAVERARFGVSGPVVNGHARMTNLSWTMSEPQLSIALGIPRVGPINDLEAIAYAIPHLGEGDLHTLNVGAPVHGGACAVIAPGTGLGEAFLTYDA